MDTRVNYMPISKAFNAEVDIMVEGTIYTGTARDQDPETAVYRAISGALGLAGNRIKEAVKVCVEVTA